MPQRFLRPGITNSQRWNRVSFKAQSLWVRLLTHVDDFGRFDGRPSVIWGSCFSVWNEENPDDVVSPQETAALCAQLADIGLLHIYETEGKKVIQITQWSERARSQKSKWPEYKGKSKNVVSPLRNPAESCGILPPSTSPSTSVIKDIDKGIESFKAVEVRVTAIFNRPDGTTLTYAEQSAISEISRRENVLDELAEIEAFHEKPENFFPQSLQKLLSTWQETLDRARTHETRKTKNANRRPNSPDRNAGTFNAQANTDDIKRKVR
jgi:hypothetical protein